MPAPLAFLPSRPAALARLEEFLPAAGHYAAERNFVRAGHQDVSQLSPWVQKRLLLESEIVAAATRRWSFPSVEKFVQEVYWRTYWKGWLEQRPTAWSRWCEAVPRLRSSLNPEQRTAWEAAIGGKTGIAGFDAWAQELVATGYLHNHARMWFASIWIFTLRLPWELGAAFFFEHLLDGDVASNTLSWRWVAGLQTPGKTYLARADNITHYTDGVHAPEAGQLASAPLNLKEEPLPKVAAWTEDAAAVASLPMYERVGLWLHPEDLAVELGELARLKLAAINASWPTSIAVRAGWSDKVSTWTQAALREGATRAGRHFAAEVAAEETSDLATTLVAWARAHHLQAVVAYRPFVGPWLAEALALETDLATAGIRIIWRRRAWDTEHFPHATRGYFPFWEKIKSAH
ncbi:deoxyribodipyrimidine photo-lyase [Verrucomicrobiota bacterium]|nr:deoxyribodipyrimidine photo-lyase [Verrucomicrobiota bacterium]